MRINLKALTEKRGEHQDKMDALLTLAQVENRALTEEETAEFDACEKAIQNIDATLNCEQRAQALSNTKPVAAAAPAVENRAEAEEKAFADYVMGRAAELRADGQTVNMTDNGAIIPTSIANKIIVAVKDRCPILKGATIYNVRGTLKVPAWGPTADGHDIAVGYHTEFNELTADAGKFTSVELSGYLAGALTLIGRSVQNNGTFDVVSFIVNQMADSIAAFLEKELLIGTEGKATGALSTTNTLEVAAAAITSDDLIALQAQVKQVFQANACWTMHPDTFLAVKKLKDGNNRHLLQDDLTGEFPYRLLGKPVHLSDNMPRIASGARSILYGDYKGLSVNMRENISIEVLREKYATQHAIGVVSWFEFDAKVTNSQMLAALVHG